MAQPTLPDPVPVLLDYDGAGDVPTILGNLSGVVAAGERLWTVSDEGRTVECLTRDGEGYRFTRQISLDDWFPGLPPGEADLESLALRGDMLWLCGSHCRARSQSAVGEPPEPRMRDRLSRNLLGAIPIDGGRRRPALPVKGKGSLRSAVASDSFLRDFLPLPSKENGFDIEGIAILGDRLFLGLRGPVIDSQAMVLEFPLSAKGKPKLSQARRHFLPLDGLGIRDLAADGERLMVLAGPVTAVPTPFQLHLWEPGAGTAPCLGRWREDGGKPEGICRLERAGRTGLLAVYDSGGDRIAGTGFRADWFPL